MKKIIALLIAVTVLLTSGVIAQTDKKMQDKSEKVKTEITQIGNKMICPVSGEEFILTEKTPKIEIDGKIYYFCCKGCLEKFKKNYKKSETPSTDLKIANKVICPVMGTKFVPTSKSPKVEYKGKTYYFCCKGCVEKFKKDPEKYISGSKIKHKHKHNKDKMCELCDEEIETSVSETREKNNHKHSKDKNIKSYTMQEVSEHNRKGDCWLVIHNKVYDVSEFSYKHNKNILLGCGKVATKLFETRTTEDGKKIGSGKPHSNYARELIKKFYIGELKN